MILQVEKERENVCEKAKWGEPVDAGERGEGSGSARKAPVCRQQYYFAMHARKHVIVLLTGVIFLPRLSPRQRDELLINPDSIMLARVPDRAREARARDPPSRIFPY